MPEQVIELRPIDLPVTDPAARAAIVAELQGQVLLIQEAMAGALVKGVHYGTIPGTQKPSLWLPGAEMLCQMFRFQTSMERTDQYEDWEKGIFSYTYKCTAVTRTGELITSREGTCSSKEPNYASKNAFQIRETLMQMAQKRAYVAAVRGSAAASAIFSQDDDIVPKGGSADKGHGICPTHKTPYYQSDKQRDAGYPPSHKDGDDWCVKDVVKPTTGAVQSPAIAARDEAMPLLDTLLGRGEEFATRRADYIKTVIRRDVEHPKDITEEEWIKVKEMAGNDLAARQLEAPPGDPNAEPVAAADEEQEEMNF